MASFFSRIRYIPNATADEAMNVGLLVASGDRIVVVPTADWRRIRYFAGGNAGELKRLVEEMQADPKQFLGIDQVNSREALVERLSRWTHSLQFSDVHASLESVDVLLYTLPPRIFCAPADEQLSLAGRRALVVGAVFSEVSAAFVRRFERRPRGLIRKQARIQGHRTLHKLPVGVANGTLYAGAFALSFATQQIDKQWQDTDAVAFAVDDINRLRVAPLAVVLDEPAVATEASTRARNIFQDMRVETVPFGELQDWAARAVQGIPEEAVAHQ